MKLPTTLTSVDTGADLVGFDLEDEEQTWTITEIGVYDESPVLYYKNKQIGEEEKSSVKEVRQWYNRTHLMQAANSITSTRKGFINSLAEASYNTIKIMMLNSQPMRSNPQATKRQEIHPTHNGSEQRKKKNKGS
jgi:hypothetical protein